MLYKTRGTCSIAIDVEVENGIVKHAQFINGCPGNTSGISQLVPACRQKKLSAA